MKAYITIKMDRPIERDRHYISPGGYAVTAAGKYYEFDFCESYGWIDENDNTIIHFELRSEDMDEFPQIEELRKHLNEITEINECFVYTGEDGDPEIAPIELIEFIIVDSGIEELEKDLESSDLVKCTVHKTNNDWTIDYELTDKLLKSYKF